MRSKAVASLMFFVLTLLVGVVLTGCGKRHSHKNVTVQEAFRDFSQIVEQAPLEGLCLKLYYLRPSILTRSPLSVEDLINHSAVEKIAVDCEQLKPHTDSLRQLYADGLVPVEKPSCLDARLCLMFETDMGGRILEIAIGGINNSVFVNGIEVEYDERFYNMIHLFVKDYVKT